MRPRPGPGAVGVLAVAGFVHPSQGKAWGHGQWVPTLRAGLLVGSFLWPAGKRLRPFFEMPAPGARPARPEVQPGCYRPRISLGVQKAKV